MFSNMKRDEILDFFKTASFSIKKYSLNEIIALEGDTCSSIGIILDGSIDIKRMLSNKTIQVTTIGYGHLFGEIIAFSGVNKYPATVVCSANAEILFITKADFIDFASKNSSFLEDFLKDLSNKILILNKSIERLSYNSIRQKICSYILDEYKNQNSLYIDINMTKQKLAETLGITRPSLSRELINMKDEKIIDYSRNTIKILDISALQKNMEE